MNQRGDAEWWLDELEGCSLLSAGELGTWRASRAGSLGASLVCKTEHPDLHFWICLSKTMIFARPGERRNDKRQTILTVTTRDHVLCH